VIVNDTMNVRIDVTVTRPNSTGYLNVSETFEITSVEFTEMAKILGQFHDLAAKVKVERAKRP